MFLVDLEIATLHILSQYLTFYFPIPEELQDIRQTPDYEKLFFTPKSEWLNFLVMHKKYDEVFAVKYAEVIWGFLENLRKNGAKYLLFHDPEYPDLGALLADLDFVVVSGGAYGCDIAAHKGALNVMKVPAPIIVVMATGLSQLYPQGNKQTFNHILAAGGIIMSERLWNSHCYRSDFPVRNRLVAGLSSLVAVMEAGSHSGAMITAKQALDQGRDVWIYHGPSKHGDIRACGNISLIEEGAPYFQTSQELVDNLSECNFH